MKSKSSGKKAFHEIREFSIHKLLLEIGFLIGKPFVPRLASVIHSIHKSVFAVDFGKFINHFVTVGLIRNILYFFNQFGIVIAGNHLDTHMFVLSARSRNQNLKLPFSSVSQSHGLGFGFGFAGMYTILSALGGKTDASASGAAGARGVPASILSIAVYLSLSISLLSISLSDGEESESRDDKGNS